MNLCVNTICCIGFTYISVYRYENIKSRLESVTVIIFSLRTPRQFIFCKVEMSYEMLY